MTATPLISLIIPCYNAGPFISEAISGFLNQTYRNFEIIIQDDCSTDGTWEKLLEDYSSNSQILLFRNPKNLGIGANWNEAYKKASGDFVVVFNADDTAHHNFLSKSLDYFAQYPSIDLVTSPYYRSDDKVDKETLDKIFMQNRGETYDLINYRRDVHYRIHWNYTVAKRSSLDRLQNTFGLFYPTQVCDAMLWYEAYKQNLRAFYTGESMGTYRIHENNNSKIPLAEFESTLLWMVPRYPDIYKLKTRNTKWNLSIKYLYACTQNNRLPRLEALKNILRHL